MSNRIRVAIAGASGRMGQEALATLRRDDRFEIAGLLVRNSRTADYHEEAGVVTDTPTELLTEAHPDVWLDFTDASSVVPHIDACLTFGVRPVIGATGYTSADIRRWDDACQTSEIGGIAAPNFAIGALLMVRFAEEAARFFPNAEIIELHHDGKKDAPSGTALRTATAMANQAEAATRNPSSASFASADEVTPAMQARGLVHDGIPIHSVRLPGLVAHQEVLFGGVGETLTIRHDSMSRTSFMQGVQFACERVMSLRGMVYGLEHLLW